MTAGNKIYFASDVYLGVPTKEESRKREKEFVEFLDKAAKDSSDIFLLGDVFDMWFEYKTFVPKGYVRLLGKLAELIDNGINIHMFTRNHDMWMFDYFEDELNIPVYKEPKKFEFSGKTFLLGHGDGLGSGDFSYKFLKKVFKSRINQWLFARLHPNFALSIANYFSKRSRLSSGGYEKDYMSDEKEYLIQYVKEKSEKEDIDYFIFGHRHIPLERKINNSLYINLGEWVHYKSYAVFDGNDLKLLNVK